MAKRLKIQEQKNGGIEIRKGWREKTGKQMKGGKTKEETKRVKKSKQEAKLENMLLPTGKDKKCE